MIYFPVRKRVHPGGFEGRRRAKRGSETVTDIIPRIISAARLTRSALRFSSEARLAEIDRSMMMACEEGKRTEERSIRKER